MAGRPAGSPMAPRAATAASRQSGSGWLRPTSDRAGTAPAAAAPDLAQGEAARFHHPGSRSREGRSAAAVRAGSKAGGQLGGPGPDLRVRSRRRPRSRPRRSGPPARARAPRAVARTAGAGSARARGRSAWSPRWPARATWRRRAVTAAVGDGQAVSWRRHGGWPWRCPTRSRSASRRRPEPDGDGDHGQCDGRPHAGEHAGAGDDAAP